MLENTTSDDIIKIIDHMKDIITPIGVEVYKIYYKQMMYSGIINTLIDLLFLIGIPYFIYYIIKHKNRLETLYNWVEDHDSGAYMFIAVIFFAIVSLIIFLEYLQVFCTIQDDVMHIINPDYYIIQNLLHG